MLRSYEYNTNENDFQQDSDSSCVSLTVEILAKLKKGCFCSLIAVGGCYQLPDNSIGVELRGCPVSPVPAKGSSSLLRVGKHGGWPRDMSWVPRCPAPSPEPQPLPGLQQELLPLHAFSWHLEPSSARPSCCTASRWHSYPKSSEKSLRLLPYSHQVWGWSLPAGSDTVGELFCPSLPLSFTQREEESGSASAEAQPGGGMRMCACIW